MSIHLYIPLFLFMYIDFLIVQYTILVCWPVTHLGNDSFIAQAFLQSYIENKLRK